MFRVMLKRVLCQVTVIIDRLTGETFTHVCNVIHGSEEACCPFILDINMHCVMSTGTVTCKLDDFLQLPNFLVFFIYITVTHQFNQW